MKKKYSKPRVTQVRLVVQNPVLGDCYSVDTAVQNGFCNVSPEGCPFP